jgi:hemerythrin superfamily protein
MSSPIDRQSPEEIESEIERTRGEVDRTLEALEERFSIRARIDNARQRLDTAKDTAVDKLSPNITNMIRMDHSHVLAAFRRYRAHMPPGRKRALVANVCLALDVHAQLEEEIFYPALRNLGVDNEVLDKSVPEHDEMRSLVSTLRNMEPDDPSLDPAFRQLIRLVLHHVADEETILLPLAEDVLADELGRLGWEMTRRRVELLKPHLIELTTTTARTFPVGSAAAVAGVLAVGWMLFRGGRKAIH